MKSKEVGEYDFPPWNSNETVGEFFILCLMFYFLDFG